MGARRQDDRRAAYSAGGHHSGGSRESPPLPAPAASEVRLVFVDVASGSIRSDPVVHPGSRFVDTFLAYFDQYALSHRVWAPDSSSMLLPEIDQGGTTLVTVRFPDGRRPLAFPGEIGFWSP